MIPLRRLVGGALRRQRQRQGRTLREVSAAARVSLGYLSEVERGHKEASSELFAAICIALDVPVSTVLREVSDELALVETAPATPSPGPAADGHAADGHAAAAASVSPTSVPTRRDVPPAATQTTTPARTTSARDLLTSAPFEPPLPAPMPGDGVAVQTLT